MPTIYHEQISTALEAEIAAKNKIIEKLQQQVNQLTRERNTIKTKWEILNDQKQTELCITKQRYQDNCDVGCCKESGQKWAIDNNVFYSGPDCEWAIVSLLELLGFKSKIFTLCSRTGKQISLISSHDE